MKTQESLENYLEAILMLSENGPVRSIDIANKMNFARPSVSIAIKNLKEKDLINVDDKGIITLTNSGLEIAESTYEKHRFFTNLLITVGVDPTIAQDDACRMEHQLSDESYQKLKVYFENK